MKKVICSLLNASNLINGVPFKPLSDGRVITDEVEDEVAAQFATIPGYQVIAVAASAAAESEEAGTDTVTETAEATAETTESAAETAEADESTTTSGKKSKKS